MKICFSSTTKEKTDQLSPRFGRCPYFLIFDEEKEDWQVLENASAQARRGAGVAAAQRIIEAGCRAVVSGNMGPRAHSALSAGEVKIYLGDSNKTVWQNLQSFQDGELEELEQVRGGRRGRGGE